MRHIIWIIVALFVMSCGNGQGPEKSSDGKGASRETVVKKEKPKETQEEGIEEGKKKARDYLEFVKGKDRETKLTVELLSEMRVNRGLVIGGIERLYQINTHKNGGPVFAKHNELKIYKKLLEKHGFKDLGEVLAFLLDSWGLYGNYQFEEGRNLAKKHKFKYDIMILLDYQARLLGGVRADLGLKDEKE
ncbi:MAG: hypothetical protein IEMM0008_0634 [bacterium]|nr:MAG: hypothetical protein IEMM0008_0634 [bacterium]